MVKNGILLLTVITFGFIMSCTNNDSGALRKRTGEIFFDNDNEKLWRHKVNSLEGLEKYTSIFNAIEFDVVFYPESNTFEVEHDPDPNSSIKLDDYFGSIEHPDSFYYWIDIKNLSMENVESLSKRMTNVLGKYNLKDRVICESYHHKPLKVLHENGLYTSYWIPHFSYKGKLEDYQKDHLNKIHQVLEDCPHNAISAFYKMFPFIKEYLPDCTTHLWTNGLKTEEDKETIKEFESYPFVKVILVDYEEPF